MSRGAAVFVLLLVAACSGGGEEGSASGSSSASASAVEDEATTTTEAAEAGRVAVPTSFRLAGRTDDGGFVSDAEGLLAARPARDRGHGRW